MASVYCEICGKEITGVVSPAQRIFRTHKASGGIVRCDECQFAPREQVYNPHTGKKVPTKW